MICGVVATSISGCGVCTVCRVVYNGTTIKKTDCSCVDWIQLARDRDKWRAPCKHGN
jgi:hypothetical protein